MPNLRAGLVVMLVPLVAGVGDPPRDLVSCSTGRPTPAPGNDIVEASGELIEAGTALAFTVTFADEPTEHAAGGTAFRVDFILKDPAVPTFSFGPYRDINRIVRYDHTDPPRASILLLAEESISSPSTVILEGRTLRITVAGRLLQVDEDLEPLPLDAIGWNVIARDGPACDRLGKGRPRQPLTEAASVLPPTTSPTVEPTNRPTPPDVPIGGGIDWGLVAAIGLVVALGLSAVAYFVLDLIGRRRTSRMPGGPK